MRKDIKTECDLCNGTGLYSGICEPIGTAIICDGCGGTGCRTFALKPFTKRAVTRKFKIVRIRKRNTLNFSEITYKEFLADKRFKLRSRKK